MKYFSSAAPITLIASALLVFAGCGSDRLSTTGPDISEDAVLTRAAHEDCTVSEFGDEVQVVSEDEIIEDGRRFTLNDTHPISSARYDAAQENLVLESFGNFGLAGVVIRNVDGQPITLKSVDIDFVPEGPGINLHVGTGPFPIIVIREEFHGTLLLDERFENANLVNIRFIGTGGGPSPASLVIDNISDCDPTPNAPPEISMTVSPTEIWPPNGRMVLVASGISASDPDGDDVDLSVEVTANQSLEDGDTQVIDNGDGTFDVLVRARRNGGKSTKGAKGKPGDRIYTITATAVDEAGNSSTASGEVTVPHDQGKK